MQDLIKTTSKYKYISFDVFDTLFYRIVDKPEDVFKIVECKLNKINSEYKCFANFRKEASNKAYSKGKAEATLDDIYNEMPYDDEMKIIAKREELQTEMEVLRPNGLLTEIINRLHSEAKQIIIISDMYLPVSFFEELFKKWRIQYDMLYVSSETQARKSTGKMFSYVLQELGIKAKEMIHVGDNKRSDYMMPRFYGIASVRWRDNTRNHVRISYDGKVSENASIAIKTALQGRMESYYGQIGYSLFGPLLFGFCKWINRIKDEEKLDKIIFLSRDGQIVRKAYQIMYPGEYKYFLASRRTLTVPMLKDVRNMDDVLKCVPYVKRQENIVDLLPKLGVGNEYIEKVMAAVGEVVYREELHGEKGEKIFDLIKEPMRVNAKREYHAAVSYIKEQIPKGHIGVVDIGWYGTMQSCLQKITETINDKDIEFFGLYLGLLKKKDGTNEDIKAKGFIYDFHDIEKTCIYDPILVYGFNGLIELMFTANHASAKRYVESDSDYRNVTCELEADKGEYSRFVAEVQEGALRFLEDLMKKDGAMTSDIDYSIAYAGIHDLLSSPSLNECTILGCLKFYDVYFEEIIQFGGWRRLLRKPKLEIRKFMNSNWKIGYLKKMFPHFNGAVIYKLMERCKGE